MLKVGIIISPSDPEKLLKVAAYAENNGFDSVWLPDHLVSSSYYRPCFDCWTMIGAIASSTDKIFISSGVSDPFRRHPIQLAQTVATLGRMFPGRIGLGIGGGEAMNLVPFGFEFDRPLSHVKEAIQTIKTLWTSTREKPGSFQGRYYSLDNAFLTTGFMEKIPAIYLAAWGRKGKQIVGQLADGWYPMLTTPVTYAEDSEEIRQSARAASRDPDMIDCVARVYTSVSKNDELARSATQKEARIRLAMDPSFVRRLEPNLKIDESFAVRTARVNENYLAAAEKASISIPDKVVDQICASGNPDQCISKLEQFIRRKANHIVVSIAGPDIFETISLYGSKIIPYLKQG